jgi:hypothetical protein
MFRKRRAGGFAFGVFTVRAKGLGRIKCSSSYDDFLKQLADFDQIEDVNLPTSLRPGITFRSYQKQGFNWLAMLHRFGVNGILADGMGLGKTIQTLAILQRAEEQNGGNNPSLIICPTSVVSNWQSEADKFFTNCPRADQFSIEGGTSGAQSHDELPRAPTRPTPILSSCLNLTGSRRRWTGGCRPWASAWERNC